MIDVNKIAKLARLKIPANKEKTYETHLNSICKYFEEIANIDTKNIEPMVTPIDIEQVFRADISENTLTTDQALANAPERMGQLFKVPPVV